MSGQLVFTAKVADFEMDYIKFGNGQRNFVILPGMSLMSVMPMAPLCAGSFKIFAEEYTVYLFDRRKEFSEDYSIDGMATDTALVMKHLGIANADMLGISQGGMIAQSIAEEFPELVRKLVLGSSSSRMNATSKAVFEEWMRLTAAGDVEKLISYFVDKVYSEKTAKLYKQTIVGMNRSATERDLQRFSVLAKANVAYDGYEALEKIKCPTFVVGAAQDQVLTIEASIEMYEKLKSCGTLCEMYMYEGYGHAAYDEAPDYRKRILEYFRKS